jgi:hypothetical protein
MTRGEARRILNQKRHRGEAAALARKFQVSRAFVTDVVNGRRTSPRALAILAAYIARAEELKTEEPKTAQAAGAEVEKPPPFESAA